LHEIIIVRHFDRRTFEMSSGAVGGEMPAGGKGCHLLDKCEAIVKDEIFQDMFR
jgi:hypothetical protein